MCVVINFIKYIFYVKRLNFLNYYIALSAQLKILILIKLTK